MKILAFLIFIFMGGVLMWYIGFIIGIVDINDAVINLLLCGIGLIFSLVSYECDRIRWTIRKQVGYLRGIEGGK